MGGEGGGAEAKGVVNDADAGAEASSIAAASAAPSTDGAATTSTRATSGSSSFSTGEIETGIADVDGVFYSTNLGHVLFFFACRREREKNLKSGNSFLFSLTDSTEEERKKQKHSAVEKRGTPFDSLSFSFSLCICACVCVVVIGGAKFKSCKGKRTAQFKTFLTFFFLCSKRAPAPEQPPPPPPQSPRPPRRRSSPGGGGPPRPPGTPPRASSRP